MQIHRTWIWKIWFYFQLNPVINDEPWSRECKFQVMTAKQPEWFIVEKNSFNQSRIWDKELELKIFLIEISWILIINLCHDFLFVRLQLKLKIQGVFDVGEKWERMEKWLRKFKAKTFWFWQEEGGGSVCVFYIPRKYEQEEEVVEETKS